MANARLRSDWEHCGIPELPAMLNEPRGGSGATRDAVCRVVSDCPGGHGEEHSRRGDFQQDESMNFSRSCGAGDPMTRNDKTRKQ